MKHIVLLFCVFLGIAFTKSSAQEISIPANIGSAHPRLLTQAKTGKTDLNRLINKEEWARNSIETIKKNINEYVTRHQSDSSWLVSRLQMYWKTHYTDVQVKNGAYVSGSGYAPIPTVRFTGTRDATSAYIRPKLEDVKPYMDEDGKIYLQNKSAGNNWEWVDPSKSGRIVEAINIEIMTKARDAAMLYWFTGEEKYGKFAYDIFNTYLSGMYYRKEPVDLNKGHDQTLVGLSSFEVIHEDVLEPLTACYDFLYGYLHKYHKSKLDIYATTFKNWADIIIKNGVPFNNWNLIEARFVLNIAIVLENNKQYADGKGCQYYLDQILNKTYTRQWALKDILQKGYDAKTGIWSESPGYSTGVLADFTGFVNFFDRTLHADFLPQMPIIPLAVLAQAQYLYPNGSIVGFGDTHYGPIRMEPMEYLIRNAKLYQKKEQEEIYTRMLKTMRNFSMDKKQQSGERAGFGALFGNPPLALSEKINSGLPEDYITATFWAPNVGWLVQRNGLDEKNGLMVSQAGSVGNHAHSNGIAMELYGKGIILAPEGGIGSSYFQADYEEYYAQFPAHNTVVVDGISAYPTMKSNHPLQLQHLYPASNQKTGYFKTVTFSDLSFLEPETNAEQNRMMSIIRINDSAGYYVDVFRSKKKLGKDKYHDYIYHNLGQDINLFDASNQKINLKPTEKLTFANEELIGYDYWYDKKEISTAADFKAVFDLNIPDKKSVQMNMWMKGYPNREVFSVKAPPSKSWRKNELIPDDIANLPLPTVVVRQNGAAWNKPFAAIYEPTESGNSALSAISAFNEGKDSTFVGLKVKHQTGDVDYIFSGTNGTKKIIFDKSEFKGTFAVIRENKTKAGFEFIFLGNGTAISFLGYGLNAVTPVSAALTLKANVFSFTSENPVQLIMPDVYGAGKKISITLNNKIIIGKRQNTNGLKQIKFEMPKCALSKFIVKEN